MDRREILRYTAYVTGAAICTPVLTSLVAGCHSDLTQTDSYQYVFFNSEQSNLLKFIVDTIMPRTDSPSATDVGVHQLIDHMVGKVYSKEDASAYQKGFIALSERLEGFVKSSPEDRLKILMQIASDSKPENKIAKDALLQLKQQTISYFLTTEEIATNYLNYLPVPGAYKPCITLEEAGGKAWAL